MAELQVEVVAVEERLWSGRASMVIARTVEGELAVLPGHAPLLGELVDPGQVRVRTAEGEISWTVNGGFLSVTADGVSVLAESAESNGSAATAR